MYNIFKNALPATLATVLGFGCSVYTLNRHEAQLKTEQLAKKQATVREGVQKVRNHMTEAMRSLAGPAHNSLRLQEAEGHLQDAQHILWANSSIHGPFYYLQVQQELEKTYPGSEDMICAMQQYISTRNVETI